MRAVVVLTDHSNRQTSMCARTMGSMRPDDGVDKTFGRRSRKAKKQKPSSQEYYCWFQVLISIVPVCRPRPIIPSFSGTKLLGEGHVTPAAPAMIGWTLCLRRCCRNKAKTPNAKEGDIFLSCLASLDGLACLFGQ